ncbi:hypothetical protein Q3C01_23745 [Bradyrhizobium sp. UFLA05-109]
MVENPAKYPFRAEIRRHFPDHCINRYEQVGIVQRQTDGRYLEPRHTEGDVLPWRSEARELRLQSAQVE